MPVPAGNSATMSVECSLMLARLGLHIIGRADALFDEFVDRLHIPAIRLHGILAILEDLGGILRNDLQRQAARIKAPQVPL